MIPKSKSQEKRLRAQRGETMSERDKDDFATIVRMVAGRSLDPATWESYVNQCMRVRDEAVREAIQKCADECEWLAQVWEELPRDREIATECRDRILALLEEKHD